MGETEVGGGVTGTHWESSCKHNPVYLPLLLQNPYVDRISLT